jgi:hypothetical protein
MRTIGCGRSELETFCCVIVLPPPVGKTTYSLINKTIESAAKETQITSMRNAAMKEFSLAESTENNEELGDIRHIDVSSDGTWITPGHSSLIGVATTIGCATGKILDTGTRSKQCKSCDF